MNLIPICIIAAKLCLGTFCLPAKPLDIATSEVLRKPPKMIDHCHFKWYIFLSPTPRNTHTERKTGG